MKKILLPTLLLLMQPAFASGDLENSIADFMTWVVLILLPIGGIYLFWTAHIYPEKVAEKKNHPQLEAIKVMCLLSLFVGGLLWPFALIWASYNYTGKKKDNEAELPEKEVNEPLQTAVEPQTTQTETE